MCIIHFMNCMYKDGFTNSTQLSQNVVWWDLVNIHLGAFLSSWFIGFRHGRIEAKKKKMVMGDWSQDQGLFPVCMNIVKSDTDSIIIKAFPTSQSVADITHLPTESERIYLFFFPDLSFFLLLNIGNNKNSNTCPPIITWREVAHDE